MSGDHNMNQKPLVKTYCGGKPNYVDEPNPPVTPAPKRKWQGLTDEDIFELRRNGAHSVSDIDFRAIEAKLKEKNA